MADVEAATELLRGNVAQQMLVSMPEEIGVFGVGYGLAGMRQILSRDPIQNASDLRGRKLRITPFVPIRDFYQLLGAAPTPMPLASVYDALANGQIDAIDMDLEVIWSQKYYDLAETLVRSNHMMFPCVGVISGKTWLALSDDDRAPGEPASSEASRRRHGTTTSQRNESGRARCGTQASTSSKLARIFLAPLSKSGMRSGPRKHRRFHGSRPKPRPMRAERQPRERTRAREHGTSYSPAAWRSAAAPTGCWAGNGTSLACSL